MPLPIMQRRLMGPRGAAATLQIGHITTCRSERTHGRVLAVCAHARQSAQPAGGSGIFGPHLTPSEGPERLDGASSVHVGLPAGLERSCNVQTVAFLPAPHLEKRRKSQRIDGDIWKKNKGLFSKTWKTIVHLSATLRAALPPKVKTLAVFWLVS